jgi:hypothetical protein
MKQRLVAFFCIAAAVAAVHPGRASAVIALTEEATYVVVLPYYENILDGGNELICDGSPFFSYLQLMVVNGSLTMVPVESLYSTGRKLTSSQVSCGEWTLYGLDTCSC